MLLQSSMMPQYGCSTCKLAAVHASAPLVGSLVAGALGEGFPAQGRPETGPSASDAPEWPAIEDWAHTHINGNLN